MSEVTAAYNQVRKAIDRAALDCGRSPQEVTLLAVSKHADIAAVQALYDGGVRDFGESREPELARKAAALPPDIRWHFIGPLQANKVRKVVRLASIIHSVDSVSLLERVDRIAGEELRRVNVYLEVNVSGESSKGGVSVAELPKLLAAARNAQNIDVVGLMTMAPLDAPEAELRKIFSTLADLAKAAELPQLSMGMSGDYAAAIAAGSTVVRIGTAIFGK